MKIVFDSSALITVSQTCLSKCISSLKEKTGIEFFISPAVFSEVVSNPLGIRRFELNAVRLRELVEKKSISVQELDRNSKEFFSKISALANNSFSIKGKALKIMHSGELEALALANQLHAEIIAVDERTTRMLVENPFALRASMEKKYSAQVSENRQNILELKNLFFQCGFVRSVELIALAFEKNALAGEIENTKKGLEAALYAAKFSGCSVSFSEIQDFLKGIRA